MIAAQRFGGGAWGGLVAEAVAVLGDADLSELCEPELLRQDRTGRLANISSPCLEILIEALRTGPRSRAPRRAIREHGVLAACFAADLTGGRNGRGSRCRRCRDTDHVTAVGCVDHEPVADVEPDVVDRVAAEDQVSGLQLIGADALAHAEQAARRVRQLQSRLAVGVHDQARAIEALARGAGSPAVRHSQLTAGRGDGRRSRGADGAGVG